MTTDSDLIFDAKPRTRHALMREGERPYAFYDSCNRQAFETFRQLVNAWAANMQPADRRDLCARMQKGSDHQFYAALAELTIHQMFFRLGHRVEVHPKLPTSDKRPDFRIISGDGIDVIAEVTTFGPSQVEVAEQNRANDVFNAITNAKLPPGYRLGYDLKSTAPANLRIRTLVSSIETWARGARHMQRAVFEQDGWSIELTLFVGKSAEIPDCGVIAASGGDARWVSGAMEIRDALDGKAKRYGTLDSPYLIVVLDCKDEIIFDPAEELNEALLGDEVVEDQLSASGGVRPYLVRKGGFWFKGRKPINTNVSAVVLLPRPDIWHMRDSEFQPIIAHNPWADAPLPEDFLPLPRYCARKDRWTREAGTIAGDLLGLPTQWPPSSR